VLVSHSRALAEGLADLVGQIAGADGSAVPAGGAPDGGLGTDPDAIAAAVRLADRGDGVVVLMDIGSAVLSLRALLEDGELDADRVRLADAPMVEGAVAAAVTASVGGDLDAVHAAAEEARDVRKL
jgi:dihydroxyacetone kinase phosphotransfer subunit